MICRSRHFQERPKEDLVWTCWRKGLRKVVFGYDEDTVQTYMFVWWEGSSLVMSMVTEVSFGSS
jgi:hypothetical protein